MRCDSYRLDVLAIMLTLTAFALPAQSPARWRGTVDLEITGEDDGGFSRIAGLTVDKSGRIYAADAKDEQIRIYTATGKRVATIGRSGSGPVEFKRLSIIGVGPDGNLWVRDEGNARLQLLDVRTTPARSVKNVPLTQYSGGSRVPFTFEADGTMADETIWFEPSTNSFRPVRTRRTPSGTIATADTLKTPPGAFDGVHRVNKVQKDASGKQIGMAQMFYWQPHGPQWIRAYGPGGVRAEVVTSRYEIRVYGANGALQRTITRTVPPVPLSARERQKADSTLADEKQNLPFGVPKAKSPIVGLFWSQDGMLWVERAVADGVPREADVFDKTGKHVAIASWPRNIDLYNGYAVANGTTVVSVATDADEVERVVRLRFR
jgi:hypothetical protein